MAETATYGRRPGRGRLRDRTCGGSVRRDACPGDAACSGGNDPTKDLSKPQAREATACLVNKERRADNLKQEDALESAAQKHNEEMADRGQLSHQFPGEPALDKRVKNAGYYRGGKNGSSGETVALNAETATPRQVVDQLLNSAEHRDILFNRRYEHIGVGVSTRDGRAFYTIVVAFRRG